MGATLVVESVLMVTPPYLQLPKLEESFVMVLQKDSLPRQQALEYFRQH
tara:strand:+ start:90 stop:236 length:147 start_codon:yes stop_codon:yes gene_type:complete